MKTEHVTQMRYSSTKSPVSREPPELLVLPPHSCPVQPYLAQRACTLYGITKPLSVLSVLSECGAVTCSRDALSGADPSCQAQSTRDQMGPVQQSARTVHRSLDALPWPDAYSQQSLWSPTFDDHDQLASHCLWTAEAVPIMLVQLPGSAVHTVQLVSAAGFYIIR